MSSLPRGGGEGDHPLRLPARAGAQGKPRCAQGGERVAGAVYPSTMLRTVPLPMLRMRRALRPRRQRRQAHQDRVDIAAGL
jgi:hypothetical protein